MAGPRSKSKAVGGGVPSGSSHTTANGGDTAGSNMMNYRTKMCKFFPLGACKKASNCSWAHHISELRAEPDLRKTKLCARNQKGECKRANCEYAHGLEEMRPRDESFKTSMCSKWQSQIPCDDPSCQYAHDPRELRTPMLNVVPATNVVDLQNWLGSQGCHPATTATTTAPTTAPTTTTAAADVAADVAAGGLNHLHLFASGLHTRPSSAVGLPLSPVVATRSGNLKKKLRQSRRGSGSKQPRQMQTPQQVSAQMGQQQLLQPGGDVAYPGMPSNMVHHGTQSPTPPLQNGTDGARTVLHPPPPPTTYPYDAQQTGSLSVPVGPEVYHHSRNAALRELMALRVDQELDDVRCRVSEDVTLRCRAVSAAIVPSSTEVDEFRTSNGSRLLCHAANGSVDPTLAYDHSEAGRLRAYTASVDEVYQQKLSGRRRPLLHSLASVSTAATTVLTSSTNNSLPSQTSTDYCMSSVDARDDHWAMTSPPDRDTFSTSSDTRSSCLDDEYVAVPTTAVHSVSRFSYDNNYAQQYRNKTADYYSRTENCTPPKTPNLRPQDSYCCCCEVASERYANKTGYEMTEGQSCSLDVQMCTLCAATSRRSCGTTCDCILPPLQCPLDTTECAAVSGSCGKAAWTSCASVQCPSGSCFDQSVEVCAEGCSAAGGRIPYSPRLLFQCDNNYHPLNTASKFTSTSTTPSLSSTVFTAALASCAASFSEQSEASASPGSVSVSITTADDNQVHQHTPAADTQIHLPSESTSTFSVSLSSTNTLSLPAAAAQRSTLQLSSPASKTQNALQSPSAIMAFGGYGMFPSSSFAPWTPAQSDATTCCPPSSQASPFSCLMDVHDGSPLSAAENKSSSAAATATTATSDGFWLPDALSPTPVSPANNFVDVHRASFGVPPPPQTNKTHSITALELAYQMAAVPQSCATSGCVPFSAASTSSATPPPPLLANPLFMASQNAAVQPAHRADIETVKSHLTLPIPVRRTNVGSPLLPAFPCLSPPAVPLPAVSMTPAGGGTPWFLDSPAGVLLSPILVYPVEVLVAAAPTHYTD